MKERISLTLDSELLKKVDSHVDGRLIASRSHAVELFVDKYMRQNRYCVILAGGDADALRIEDGTYRPLVEINGRTLISHIRDAAEKAGYGRLIVVGSRQILDAIRTAMADAVYIEENRHGTATALLAARQYLKDTFMFVPCDHFFDFDMKKLEYVHKSGNFTATLAVYASTEPDKIGSLIDMDGNEVIHYWEKPGNYVTFLNATFIGFAEPEIFTSISGASLQEDTFPLLIKHRKLGGAIMSGRFANIHSQKDVDNIE